MLVCNFVLLVARFFTKISDRHLATEHACTSHYNTVLRIYKIVILHVEYMENSLSLINKPRIKT
jgi:hypothetical protein